ncbi:chitinase [Lactarius psammicola]|nr:chitinase [Lactarius psammicola]
MFSRFDFFLLAQLFWVVPTCSLVTPTHRSLTDHASTVAATWYAGWHSTDFTLQDVSWSKYSDVIYAFAVTTPDVNVIGLADSDKELLPQFVQTAHANNVHALLSIGGWTGSRYFSSAVATDANRTAFAEAVMNLVSTYNLDGVEFDWESPNKQTIGCNLISADDSANFLSFLQTLRNQDGAKDLIISAAVSITPFVGPDGNPLTDVSGFATVLDYIEIMNYDVWGSWSSGVGPNSPLDDSCAAPANQQGSAVSAIKAWSTAGFPTNKIILGVAAYGHSFHVNQSSALDASGNINFNPRGTDGMALQVGVDVCGNPNVVGGVFTFWGLNEAGFLKDDGTVADGIKYTFNCCSKTPYVYNSNSQVMLSFDDAASFAAKGQYIKDTGLAGFALWETGGDLHDILLDAIKSTVGCPA